MTKKEDAMFYGAASEVVTPFTKDGAVDHALLAEEVRFMLSEGVTGIFVNGLASEFLMMTERERMECAKTVIGVCKGKAPVVGNIYANSTFYACEMAKEYRELGADAVMIFTPYIYPYTKEMTLEYFSRIADAAALPVYICNVSDSVNKYSPALLAEIFAKDDRFRGYKDGTQNIIDQQTLIDLIPAQRHFELIAGSDAQLRTTMMLGGVGIISLITTVFPSLIVDTVDACEKKNETLSAQLQAKVIRVRQALKTGPFMAAYKYAARKAGRDLGYMRHPLAEVSEKDAEIIDSILQREQMI